VKITEVDHIFGATLLHFQGYGFETKNGLGYILSDFFFQTHPVTLQE
jgi:hypothetical protein